MPTKEQFPIDNVTDPDEFPERDHNCLEQDNQVFPQLDQALRPNQRASSELRTVVVCGMAGLGKRELVSRYLVSRKEKFDAMLEMAHTESDFEQIFQHLKLHELYGAPTQATGQKTKDLVHKWFSCPRKDFKDKKAGKASWLLLHNESDVPPNALPINERWPLSGNGAIIVITPNRMFGDEPWSSSQVVEVPSLSDDSGAKLLKFLAQEYDKEEEEENNGIDEHIKIFNEMRSSFQQPEREFQEMVKLKQVLIRTRMGNDYGGHEFLKILSRRLGGMPRAIDHMCDMGGAAEKWSTTKAVFEGEVNPTKFGVDWQDSGIYGAYESLYSDWKLDDPRSIRLIHTLVAMVAELSSDRIPEKAFYRHVAELRDEKPRPENDTKKMRVRGPKATTRSPQQASASLPQPDDQVSKPRSKLVKSRGNKMWTKSQYEEARYELLSRSLGKVVRSENGESMLHVPWIVQEVMRTRNHNKS